MQIDSSELSRRPILSVSVDPLSAVSSSVLRFYSFISYLRDRTLTFYLQIN